MSRPSCTVLGGPNGSGKSTLQHRLGLMGEFVNADAVARTLRPDTPEKASMAAGRHVLTRLRELIAARRNFIYETTLSSAQSLDVMRQAKSAGYEVSLLFVTLSSPDLNVMRVAERVAKGGHDIPERDVRRRHASAFARLTQALPLADSIVICDNSRLTPEMLVRMQDGVVLDRRLDASRDLHRHLAAAVATALDVDHPLGGSRLIRDRSV